MKYLFIFFLLYTSAVAAQDTLLISSITVRNGEGVLESQSRYEYEHCGRLFYSLAIDEIFGDLRETINEYDQHNRVVRSICRSFANEFLDSTIFEYHLDTVIISFYSPTARWMTKKIGDRLIYRLNINIDTFGHFSDETVDSVFWNSDYSCCHTVTYKISVSDASKEMPVAPLLNETELIFWRKKRDSGILSEMWEEFNSFGERSSVIEYNYNDFSDSYELWKYDEDGRRTESHWCSNQYQDTQSEYYFYKQADSAIIERHVLSGDSGFLLIAHNRQNFACVTWQEQFDNNGRLISVTKSSYNDLGYIQKLVFFIVESNSSQNLIINQTYDYLYQSFPISCFR